MELPNLDSRLDHAIVQSVSYGPRGEVILALQPLRWCGQSPPADPTLLLRFDDVVNLDDVRAFFTGLPDSGIELTHVRYAFGTLPRPSAVTVNIQCEGADGMLRILCGGLSLTHADGSAL